MKYTYIERYAGLDFAHLIFVCSLATFIFFSCGRSVNESKGTNSSTDQSEISSIDAAEDPKDPSQIKLGGENDIATSTEFSTSDPSASPQRPSSSDLKDLPDPPVCDDSELNELLAESTAVQAKIAELLARPDPPTDEIQKLIAALEDLIAKLNAKIAELEKELEKCRGSGSGDPHYTVGHEGKSVSFTHHGINGHTYLLFTGSNISVEGIYVPTFDPDAPQVIGVVVIRFAESFGIPPISWDLAGSPMIEGKVIGGEVIVLNNGSRVHFDGKLVVEASTGGLIEIENSKSDMSVNVLGAMHSMGGILGMAMQKQRALTELECDEFDITR